MWPRLPCWPSPRRQRPRADGAKQAARAHGSRAQQGERSPRVPGARCVCPPVNGGSIWGGAPGRLASDPARQGRPGAPVSSSVGVGSVTERRVPCRTWSWPGPRRRRRPPWELPGRVPFTPQLALHWPLPAGAQGSVHWEVRKGPPRFGLKPGRRGEGSGKRAQGSECPAWTREGLCGFPNLWGWQMTLQGLSVRSPSGGDSRGFVSKAGTSRAV